MDLTEWVVLGFVALGIGLFWLSRLVGRRMEAQQRATFAAATVPAPPPDRDLADGLRTMRIPDHAVQSRQI